MRILHGHRRLTPKLIYNYEILMRVTLTPEQQALLITYVERREFASIEDAARQLLDESLAKRAAEESEDLAWAKPFVDQARADIARGDVPLGKRSRHTSMPELAP